MNGEIYYIVGKPANLKHEFFNQLWRIAQDDDSLRIPRLFTTNPALHELDNIFYIDERDFELRESMGIYCLTWTKAGHSYGVCAEGTQWAQNGYTVLINGSLHNLNQAMKIFPDVNVVMLRLQSEDELVTGNTLIESEDAHLDWVSSANGICYPYVLSVSDQESTHSASELLLDLIECNRNLVLEKAV